MALELAESFEKTRLGILPSLPAGPPPTSATNSSAMPRVVIGITLLEAWNRYLADPSSTRSRKTTLAYETVRNIVVSILGEGRIVSELGRQDCRRVLEVLQHLPSNYGKRWPNMTPEAIAEMARRDNLQPMSAANCNGYMSRWSGMMNWLVKEELSTRNPCIGLRVADPVPVREKRRPFSTDQLQRIFSGEPYEDLRDVCEGKALPRSPARFYVPLIAVFSGLRQNEICQQTVDDILELDGVFCFVVKADTALGKRVKTNSSERVVPIHPALIRARLLDHWGRCGKASETRLWPELERDRFGYASAYFSKWFARYLTKTGGKAERTTFHSFRHCFRDAMRAGRVEREIAFALGGWTGSRSGTVAVGDIYGSGFRIGALSEAISKVHYDVPALSQLTERVEVLDPHQLCHT
jgi:integrase